MIQKSLLWEISSLSGTTSYLFGTMHVKDNRAYHHTQRALKAIYNCSHFMAEINLDEAKEQMNPSAYLFPDNLALTQLLSPKKFSKYESILKKSFGLELSHYKGFLPLIIINKLAELVLDEDKHQALDAYLWTEAKKLKLSCSGLESLDEQIEILNSLSLEVQMKMLKEVTKGVSKFRKSIEQLSDLYVQEDIVNLYKKTRKSLGKLRYEMLYKRNKLMADRIADNIAVPCFYAIGAAHLAGNKGVIVELKKKGLKLKAV